MTRRPVFLRSSILRFGGPHQEGRDVARILRDCLGRSIGVIDLAIAERLGHRDHIAGKIGVPLVVALLRIAVQQSHDIVDALLLIGRTGSMSMMNNGKPRS